MGCLSGWPGVVGCLGRGIAMGLSYDGRAIVQAFFLMARRPEHRLRTLEVRGQTVILTWMGSRNPDPETGADLLYAPMDSKGDLFVVSNGIQTKRILRHLKRGGDPKHLGKVTRDAPPSEVTTPRISASCSTRPGIPKLTFAVVRPGSQVDPEIEVFQYDADVPGRAYVVTTYAETQGVLDSFRGEPWQISALGTPEQILETLWRSLDPAIRIGAVVRRIDLESGCSSFWLRNRLRG